MNKLCGTGLAVSLLALAMATPAAATGNGEAGPKTHAAAALGGAGAETTCSVRHYEAMQAVLAAMAEHATRPGWGWDESVD